MANPTDPVKNKEALMEGLEQLDPILGINRYVACIGDLYPKWGPTLPTLP